MMSMLVCCLWALAGYCPQLGSAPRLEANKGVGQFLWGLILFLSLRLVTICHLFSFFFQFWTTLGSTQALLLTLCSEITSRGPLDICLASDETWVDKVQGRHVTRCAVALAPYTPSWVNPELHVLFHSPSRQPNLEFIGLIEPNVL